MPAPVLHYHRRENGMGATMRRMILTAALIIGLAVPAWADDPESRISDPT